MTQIIRIPKFDSRCNNAQEAADRIKAMLATGRAFTAGDFATIARADTHMIRGAITILMAEGVIRRAHMLNGGTSIYQIRRMAR
jgi:hypothetical protein